MIHDDDGQRALLVQTGDDVIFELLARIIVPSYARFTIPSGAHPTPSTALLAPGADACYWRFVIV